MSAIRYIVSGKVQGVFFRAWTRDQARSLGVSGWVRNRPDGTVEALAVADEATQARFRQRLEQGPPLSRVSGLQALPAEAGAEADAPMPFDVRY
jgi:acylphosphatase